MTRTLRNLPPGVLAGNSSRAVTVESVSVITMAGMKKMNVTRDWVIGKIAQCSAAAPNPMSAANPSRRGAVFSIHGHNREKRSSVFSREIRR